MQRTAPVCICPLQTGHWPLSSNDFITVPWRFFWSVIRLCRIVVPRLNQHSHLKLGMPPSNGPKRRLHRQLVARDKVHLQSENAEEQVAGSELCHGRLQLESVP